MRVFYFCLALLLSLGSATAQQQASLPMFLSDNHAESFAWFAKVLDLDEPTTLILIDHHSDATWAEKSDDLREGLRRVRSVSERAQRCEAWRAEGRIQAYNWIEPLMPRPFSSVYWLGRKTLTASERQALLTEATESVDARLEFEKRSAGSLASRWRVMASEELPQHRALPGRVAASVDLDYFMEMEETERHAAFTKQWKWLMGQPGLLTVSFCLSRPWLTDDAEATALLALALQAVEGVRGGHLTLHLGLDRHPDTSKQFQQLVKKHGKAAKWDAAASSAAVRQILLRNRGHWAFTDPDRAWPSLLQNWAESEATPDALRIAVEGLQPCTDGIFRWEKSQSELTLRVHQLPAAASGRVRWRLLKPQHMAVDFLLDAGLGKDFTKFPARWVSEWPVLLTETKDPALAWPAELLTLGQHRVQALVECGGEWISTPPMELRITEGKGFHAGLSECFQMPYVFGIAQARDAETGSAGVETAWGSDCSNMLVYAWRKSGVRLTWGDPLTISQQLERIQEAIDRNVKLPLSSEATERGVVVSFGSHMAALWQDIAPVGILTAADVFVHHLGGPPDLLPLGSLLQKYPKADVFSLPPASAASCTLVFAGDVVLRDAAEKELAPLKKAASGADAVFVNLEGIPTNLPVKVGVKYDFRFPPERLAWLKNSGITSVSLANNHAGDADAVGLQQALEHCERHQLPSIGAGRLAKAVSPLLLERNGQALAVFAVSVTDALTASKEQVGVARLPEHETELALALQTARSDRRTIIVQVHWGQEYRPEITSEQRQWATWLINRGATAIVGSHPHVNQAVETLRGCCVAYSLGNCVYPSSLSQRDSGNLLRLVLEPSGRLVQYSLEPTP